MGGPHFLVLIPSDCEELLQIPFDSIYMFPRTLQRVQSSGLNCYEELL